MEAQIDINTIDFSQIKVNDIVVDNYKASEIFQKHGIDFCCHGNRPLQEALNEKQITKESFLKEYNSLIKTSAPDLTSAGEWDLNLLIQHIVDTHHAYVKSAVPEISAYLDKIVDVHGKNHPYLNEIRAAFFTIGDDMKQHMIKEETILFPLIKYLLESEKFNERPKTRGYGSISSPIKKMEEEHVSAGDLLGKIRHLSDNYTLPSDACNTFSITYKKLEEFENDLFKHVHLENNILFPRSIKLEEKLNNLHE